MPAVLMGDTGTNGAERACPCGAAALTPVFEFTAPPAGEVRYQFASAGAYRRRLLRCDNCGHFVSVHSMDAGGLYSGPYVTATYGDDGMSAAFDRIVKLPPERSDNAGRVRRVREFADCHFAGAAVQRTILDVGSGLCVFLHGMKAAGWTCTALDPDPRAANHARNRVGVDARHGDLVSVVDLGRFDVVTLNKVLEHVDDPAAMLARAARHVREGGFVYVEVPDGEHAIVEGVDREEFFIDHLHAFSASSLGVLAERGGFGTARLEAIREPSGKYTLFAFLLPDDSRDRH